VARVTGGSRRPVEVVDTRDAAEVSAALERALSGAGPAILPRNPAAASGDGAALEIPADAPEDACLVIETSGSTAAPKRVLLGASAIHASNAATYRRLDELVTEGDSRGPAKAIREEDRQWLLALPLEFIAGTQVLARSITAGTEPVLLGAGTFTPERFLAACERMEASHRYVSLVPAQLLRLLDAAEGVSRQTESASAAATRTDSVLASELADACTSFDAMLLGGQATPQSAKDRAARLGWRVVTTYGSSETAGGCVYNGESLDGVRVAERDGEIEIAGPTLAWGYLGDTDRTADRFVNRGGERWYRTSDAGTVTEFSSGRQQVTVTGRLDDVIISGGEKVLLGRIEQLVRSFPPLADAIVVGAPSAQWGQVPVIVAERIGAAEREALLDRIRGLAGDELGRAFRPADLVVLGALPRLVSGKPDRRQVAEIVRNPIRP